MKLVLIMMRYIGFNHFAGARVGFDQKSYKVDEAIGMVEICAVVHEPDIDCPIEFEFSVTLETRDSTAGIYKHVCTTVTLHSQRISES